MERQTFKMLSIVVPVYNEDRYLDAVISRVIAQPLPSGLERELILVNDVSQDATWDIMQSLPDKFPSIRFRLVNKPVMRAMARP